MQASRLLTTTQQTPQIIAPTPNQLIPFRHQQQLIVAPFHAKLENIDNFFLIGGYSCGKTSGAVFLLMYLARRYWKHPVVIGVGGPTLTFLKKTLITDFERLLIQTRSAYHFDKQANIITIGAMKFVLIAMDQPNLIYGYNFNAFIGDELDELTQVVSQDAFKAIQERVRITFPDGRLPFSVFPTTAQGYKGTYQIIEELKEAGTGYWKVRGITADNTSLTPKYLQRLTSLYDENERLAFLEGHFVNLSTGRVYPAYDESTCKITFFDLYDHDEVWVGQDLNAGFSKGTAITKRDGILYVHEEFDFKVIGNAPEMLRMRFPTQTINWLPDASGNELLNGYKEEMANYDINRHIGTFNAPIIDRVFFVNKMFKLGKLKLVGKLKQLPMALKTRQFDDTGKPEKGKGPTAPDHICDSLEYAVWRIVSRDPDFFDLYELTKTYRQQQARGVESKAS